MIFNFQTCKFCSLHLNNKKKFKKNLAQNSQRPLSPAQLNPLSHLQACFFSQPRLRANERPDLIKSKTKKIKRKKPSITSSPSLPRPLHCRRLIPPRHPRHPGPHRRPPLLYSLHPHPPPPPLPSPPHPRLQTPTPYTTPSSPPPHRLHLEHPSPTP